MTFGLPNFVYRQRIAKEFSCLNFITPRLTVGSVRVQKPVIKLSVTEVDIPLVIGLKSEVSPSSGFQVPLTVRVGSSFEKGVEIWE